MSQLDLFGNKQEVFQYPDYEPPQHFDVIYCDPPWDYDGRTFLNGKAHETGAASDHYPTMKPEELCAMNVNLITERNCICYMWTTGPQLDVSIDVLKAWGFKFKTIAFVWNKCITNPGYYTMSSCEICIVGTKNAIPKPRGTRNELQYYSRQRTKHSSKPEEFIKRISRMHPTQNKIELFSRSAHPEWYCWGHDAHGEGAVTIPKLEGADISANVKNIIWPLPF
jgi:N6-adenosine-specific RNA methylase IME4